MWMRSLYGKHLAPVSCTEQPLCLHHTGGQDEVRRIDSFDAVRQGLGLVLKHQATLVQARGNIRLKLAAIPTSYLLLLLPARPFP